jgi:acetyl-CoA synthetase
MLPAIRDYDELCRQFRWQIPTRYNIGVDVCDRWAHLAPERLAILDVGADGRVRPISFGWLQQTSNRLANAFYAHGIGRGDRVAILLPQTPEVAAIHGAIYKLGAIALPLATLFGTDALSYRLQDSGAKAAVTNAAGVAKLAAIRDETPELALVLSTEGAEDAVMDFDSTLERASTAFAAVDTTPDDPAMMIYTSGTTGPPKGALHAHRVLLGHLPGVQMPHDFFPQADDRFWTPADWAWAGGLLDVLLPSLHFGVPVVAWRFDKFDPEQACALMATHEVRNAFIPPTALRMLRSAGEPRHRDRLKLRTVASGGEGLGAATFAWGASALGLAINEFYGQTECNLVVASCAKMRVSRPMRHRQAGARSRRGGDWP